MGSSGAGKSTLSQTLGRLFQLPVIHLDRYYWKPGWVAAANDEFDQQVIEFAQKDEWIMDGNYSRTLDLRIRRADLIIYLDMPMPLCLYRVIERRIVYHKKHRPDMNEGCDEKIDWAFLKWVWNYRKRSRMHTIQKLEQVKDDKQVIILKGRNQVERFIESVGK